MSKLARRQDLKQVFPWLIVATVATIYMWHFNNLNNDFQVFYKAGIDLLDGVNPWGSRIDQNAMYLNGSTTLILLSLLSLLPLDWALFVVRLSSLTLVALAVFFGRNLSHKLSAAQLILFLFLSFPVRSALEYGQLTIVFSALAFYTLIKIHQKSNDTFLIILSVAVVLDFKPHIFIGVIIYLILIKRFKLLVKAFLIWLIFQVIVGLYLQIFPFIEMLKAVQFRSGTVTEGEDSFSIVSFLSLTPHWSTVTIVISILVFLVYSFTVKRYPISKLLPLLAFSLLITPLLHPTDLMLLLFVFVIKFQFTYVGSFVLGMFFVWSPQPSGAGFTLVVVLMTIGLSTLFNQQVSASKMAVLFIPNIIYLSSVGAGVDEVNVRHSVHLLIPIFIGVYYSLIASKIDSDAEKAG
jgi:hypothetical protein